MWRRAPKEEAAAFIETNQRKIRLPLAGKQFHWFPPTIFPPLSSALPAPASAYNLAEPGLRNLPVLIFGNILVFRMGHLSRLWNMMWMGDLS